MDGVLRVGIEKKKKKRTGMKKLKLMEEWIDLGVIVCESEY